MRIYTKTKEACQKIYEEDREKLISPQRIPDIYFDECADSEKSFSPKEHSIVTLFNYAFSSEYLLFIDKDIWSDEEDDYVLNTALLCQVLSGNYPDLKLFNTACRDTFPNSSVGGFDYSKFKKLNWQGKHCDSTPLKQYKWLFLKPDILENLLKAVVESYPENVDIYQNRIVKTLFTHPDNIRLWFDIGESFCPCYFEDIIILYLKYDENKLQRKEDPLSRRDGYSGNILHGGGYKPQITVGHLSNQTVTFRN